MTPAKKNLLSTVPGQRHEIYPEAIERNEEDKTAWKVTNGWPPKTDLKQHKVKAPLIDYVCPCGENHADAMRLQQYGHVAWTPDNSEDQAWAYDEMVAKSDFRQVVEESRVLQLASHHIYSDIASPVCVNQIEGQLLRSMSGQDPKNLIAAMVAANATDQGANIVRKVIKRVKNDAPLLFPYLAYVQESIQQHIHKQGNHGSYQDTLDLTYRLEAANQNMEEVFQILAEAEEAQKNEDITDTEMMAKDWGHAIPEVTNREAQWMNMRIERAPLTMKAAVKPTRKWTARDEGTIPRSIHRYSVDGRIFAQPVHKEHGYTLLIDCSGSMSWSPQDLHEVLAKAPATTVALYSAGNNLGILRIVSRDGRRAIDSFIEPPNGGNNGVDGPALRWLAKQKGLKIWLSDGHVTGTGDGSNENLWEEAKMIVKKGRIMQTYSAEETIKVVKGELPWRHRGAKRKGE